MRRVPTNRRGSSFMSATRCGPFSSDPLDFQRANDFHRWTPLSLYYNSHWHRGRANGGTANSKRVQGSYEIPLNLVNGKMIPFTFYIIQRRGPGRHFRVNLQ
ncbi:hypothetical protein J6590_086347 [Homalodisca vitripennis]|nr:hypothetical protein J6590_086347 [Homalodisca vitripennis]